MFAPKFHRSPRQTFGGVALLAINLLAAGPALATGDLHTAVGVVAVCGISLRDTDPSLVVRGMFFGGVTAFLKTLGGKGAPADVPGQQLMRTVVDYIDSQPRARLNEPFNHLAIEAML